MVWVPDPNNSEKTIWIKGQEDPGSKQIRLPSAGGVLPSPHRLSQLPSSSGGVLPPPRGLSQLPSSSKGKEWRLPSAGGGGAVLSSPRGLSQLPSSSNYGEVSKSDGQERQKTPPTPPMAPESSKGKREASPDLASLAFVGGSVVPSSKRRAKAAAVTPAVEVPINVLIGKLTGDGAGTHWEGLQQKINGEWKSIVPIHNLHPVVVREWLPWLEKHGWEKWNISPETMAMLRARAEQAGANSIYDHPELLVTKTTQDGDCGYDMFRIAMQELPVDERMKIQEMRERVGGLVTQEHFAHEKALNVKKRPKYLQGTLKDYQDAIRRKKVWIDHFAINEILFKCGLRALIWDSSENVKGKEDPKVKHSAEFYGLGDF